MPQQAQPREGPLYQYLEINEAISKIDQQVYFYGIVTNVSPMKQTRYGDFMTIVTVADPSTRSTSGLEHGVQVLCFAKQIESTPAPQRMGDIIRFNRVRVQDYQGRPQLIARLYGHKTYNNAAFCLFSGFQDDERPYQCSSERFTWHPHETRILEYLRGKREELTVVDGAPRLGPNAYRRQIKELKPLEYVDIVCKVLSKGSLANDITVVFVWDGTDAMPFPGDFTLEHQHDQQNGTNVNPPRQNCALAIPFQNMTDEARNGLPALGTALPVIVHVANIALPEIGDWIKVRNVRTVVVDGQLQAHYGSRSKWDHYSAAGQETDDVQTIQAAYAMRVDARLVSTHASMIRTSYLSFVEHQYQNQPFTTLRDVLIDTALCEPQCYRCLVRIYDFSPSNSQEMTHSAAECGIAQDASDDGWVYTVMLRLEDATGRLDVNAFGKEASKFFKLPAKDLRGDEEGALQLKGRVESLVCYDLQAE